MSRGRFYVTKNGVEQKNHPLNGAVWGGTSGPVGKVGGWDVHDGVYVIIYTTDGPQNIPVKAEDIQDSPVMVKEWFPPGATVTPRTFVFGSERQVKEAGRPFQSA